MKVFPHTGLILAIVCCFQFPVHTYSQESDLTVFNSYLETAKWLTEYESIGWLANETDQQFAEKPFIRLGQKGFCFQDSTGIWYILYAGQQSATFSTVWKVSADKVDKLPDPDTTMAFQSVQLALEDINLAMKDVADSLNIHLDQFVQMQKDGSFEIYIFPSFQPSGQGIYGAEWRFHYSTEGKRMPGQFTYLKELKGVWIGQPRDLWLDYTGLDSPTLGAVYFAWYYKDFFTRIHINNRLNKSTLEKDASGNYQWTHQQKL